MTSSFPLLKMIGPDGQQFEVELREDRVTIGRGKERNDIDLEGPVEVPLEGSYNLISRRSPCIVERSEKVWWVLNNGSRNPLSLRRAGQKIVVEDRLQLEEQDTILILARKQENEERYWELTFTDPGVTHESEPTPEVKYLVYDLHAGSLFLVKNGKKREVNDLRPMERKFIMHLDRLNRDHGYKPVLCPNEEIMEVLWGTTDRLTDLAKLISDLRRKIGDEDLIERVKAVGVRLNSRAR